jgi:hypothetical protein
VEPGGTYEQELIEMMSNARSPKPLLVYVAGEIAELFNVDLGHAGAVVEGRMSSAGAKKKAFDEYFGIPAFQPEKRYRKSRDLVQALSRGMRIQALHHLPEAAGMILNFLGLKRDAADARPLRLNPWFINLGELRGNLPPELALNPGVIPEPYASQLKLQEQALASEMIRQQMRNTSHASSNDGKVPRIDGYPVTDLMKKRSMTASLVLYWTGELPRDEFEERLAEIGLIASLTNGPGTISCQGAKLSASAGNGPHTAMIATLATIGAVHGGNGSDAVRLLLAAFLKEAGRTNVFLDFYHAPAEALKDNGSTRNVLAVNVDAAIACRTSR